MLRWDESPPLEPTSFILSKFGAPFYYVIAKEAEGANLLGNFETEWKFMFFVRKNVNFLLESWLLAEHPNCKVF